MSVEEELKKLILSKYKSIRDFAISCEIPYSTLDSIFKRGVDKANVTSIIKICSELGLSVDSLANGEISPKIEEENKKKTIEALLDQKPRQAVIMYKDGSGNQETKELSEEQYKKVLKFLDMLDN